MIVTTGSMAALGLILFIADRTRWRGTIGASSMPLIALIATLVQCSGLDHDAGVRPSAPLPAFSTPGAGGSGGIGS